MTTNKNVFLFFLLILFWFNSAVAAPVTIADIISARSASTLKEAWLSGSSSSVYTIFRGFSLVCDANTVSVFNAGTVTTAQKPGSVNAGDLLAYACKRGTTLVVAYHSVEGGSFNAYLPHLPAGSAGVPGLVVLRRLKALDNSTCLITTGTLNLGTDNTVVPVYGSCGVVTPSSSTVTTEVTAALKPPALPTGGFSDIEYSKSTLPSASLNVSLYGLEAQINLNEVLGVAVSTNLYRALQVAQGIGLPTTGTNTADINFDPALAPNIKSSLYTYLVATGGSDRDWSPILGNPGIGKKVTIARRNNTSGTQASSNVFFLKNPCASGVAGNLFPSTVLDTGPTLLVTEDSSSSKIKSRLSSAYVANEFAVGALSLENNWRTDTDNNQYRFVKLDGVGVS